MHGKNLKKAPGFIVFFNTNDDGSLTNQTKLYRDILRFCTATNIETYFKSRQLTNWLLKNNREFIDAYSGYYESRTNISNRVENRLDRVTKCLNSMIEMGILEQRNTKSTKGDSTTTEYALNGLGWLIGLFLESLESPKKVEIYEKIFNIFELYFRDDPSSMDTFCLTFFKNLKEQGLFEEHIDNIKQFFFLSDISWHDALKYVVCLPLSTDKSGRDRWKIWKQSLNRLEPLTKALFLYQLKLYFDRMMERHVNSFKAYELARAQIIEHEDMIIIEMECKKCKTYRPAFVNILLYLDTIYSKSELPFHKLSSGKLVESKAVCEKCNTKLDFEKLII
jgi:hypothetical protein